MMMMMMMMMIISFIFFLAFFFVVLPAAVAVFFWRICEKWHRLSAPFRTHLSTTKQAIEKKLHNEAEHHG